MTPVEIEMVVQAYALTGNKAKVARDLSCSPSTVAKIIKEATLNKDLQAARTNTLNDLAGRVHGKTIDILESITPSDMESGRQLRRNANGEIIGKTEWGPSLLQKVTAAAILTDKTKIIEETKAALNADQAGGEQGLMLPSTVQSALRMLGSKISRIKGFEIQFEDKHQDLTQRIQDTVAAAEASPHVEEADYEEISLDDFDGNSAGES